MNHAQDGLKSHPSFQGGSCRSNGRRNAFRWQSLLGTSRPYQHLGSSQTDCPEVSLEGKTWGDLGRYREDIGKISGRGISRNISEYFSDLQILADTCRNLQKHPKWSLRHTLSNQTLRRFRSHFWRFLPDLCRLGWHVSWTQVMSVGSDIFCGSTKAHSLVHLRVRQGFHMFHRV